MKTLARLHWLAAAGAMLLLMGCTSYPDCDNDKDCAEKGEYCVNAQCKQCRDDASCGEGKICNGGACSGIPGYCSAAMPCTPPMKCRNNRCGPECLDDTECAQNEMCENGSCKLRPQCTSDDQCADNEYCDLATGTCKVRQQACFTQPIYFDFDEYSFRSEYTSTMEENAECLEKLEATGVKVTGHCDERGTEEYNLRLGERRAKTAAKQLKRAGWKGSIEQDSRGEYELKVPNARTEDQHQKNRRAEFEEQ